MKFSTPVSRASKGQMKCHDCRRVFPMKDGDWHDRGNMQVFLCKVCNKTQHEPQYKQPSNH